MNERANKSLDKRQRIIFLFLSANCELLRYLCARLCVRERVTYCNTCLCRLHQGCSGSLSENHNRPETMKDKTHIEYYLGHLYRKYWSHFSADQK